LTKGGRTVIDGLDGFGPAPFAAGISPAATAPLGGLSAATAIAATKYVGVLSATKAVIRSAVAGPYGTVGDGGAPDRAPVLLESADGTGSSAPVR
jgi:hypothetical protein